ncbi:MAG: hypothetical protein H7210_11150, partial [Pyrinomonadaceae bacterium]|nr:hypothetical protein [Phycisphaerales bacterium]
MPLDIPETQTPKEPEARYSTACPRCGYDQSGLIATWQSECPLIGTCSECGLAFDWTDVLHAHTKLEPRFVEHAPIGRVGARVFAAAWRTLGWAIRPWMFWRTVKLHHPIRSLRWLVWLLLILPALHALGVLFAVVAFLQRFGSVVNATSWMFFRPGAVPKPATWTSSDALLVFLAHIGRPFLEI